MLNERRRCLWSEFSSMTPCIGVCLIRRPQKALGALLLGEIGLVVKRCIVVILLETRVSTVKLGTAASLLVTEVLACVRSEEAYSMVVSDPHL